MPVPEKAWITAAWDEKTSLRAIVLANSLRKVVTHGTLVVLISKNISDSIRELLIETFDVLHDVDSLGFDQNGLSILDCAKISSWKFYWWKKCVFLEPNNIVLQNCDELFDIQDLFSAPSVRKDDENQHESSVFTFQPSYKVYKQLRKLASEKRFKNVDDLFKCCFQTWTPLQPQYFCISPRNAGDAKIASLSDIRPWKNIEKNGIEQIELLEIDIVGKKWLDMFLEDLEMNLTPQHVIDANVDLKKVKAVKEILKGGYFANTNASKDVHNYLQDSIAVIGYSCRYPSANNAAEFWELLKSGGDGITQMPLERLTESQLEDPKLTSVKAGFLKCPIDEFDAKFFGISPREAVFMDPQQRLLTEVAWEALENAGINPHSLKGSNTGVFTGVWTHEYESLLTHNSTGADFHHVILGNTYSATSARVSYVLGLNGPNIVTESGCSSSMVSVHLACQSLRRNESNMTLVGGVNLLCNQFPHSEVSILAKDGHCKTFDEKADGFARGEGVGVLVLKKYSDAVRDGDRLMAIIRGTGISNEGTTNSFGTPSKFCQEIAIKEALKDSGVNPLVVDYVEAHGTGTPIGDPIEFGAIAAGYSGPREKPLIVGSVKTNIGHSEAAAGVAGIIKVIMALENELIPQHRNLDTLNPNINLESVPAVIPTSPIEWPRQNNIPRIAGASSFGISGTNVHVLIQEPPQIKEKLCPLSLDMAREHEVLTLSAKSEESVKELAQKYISYFDKNPNVNLKDVVFTANNGRANFRHRIAVVGKDVSEMKQNLQKELYISGSANINAKPVVAFLFTGQGSQYTGMAKSLYETSEIFKDTLDLCARILRNNCTMSLYDILWRDSALIDQTLFSQIAIFCVEYALLKLWESLGIQPDYVLGHSVGEFAAAVAAGVLDLKDAITLVTERSRLIHNLPQGKMLAVRASLETVKYCLSEFQQAGANSNHWLDIAVINSNDEVVLAGKEDSMLAFIEFSKSKATNMKTQFLAASHAFHSRDMEDIMENFGNVANKIVYQDPKCIYISGSTGKVLKQEDFGAEYWQKHARYCVDFVSSIKSLESHGCNTFIEIGAHPILLALTMNNLVPSQDKEYLMLPSIRKTEHEWVTLMNSLAKLYVSGFGVDWRKVLKKEIRNKIELPTYPFEKQKYWPDVNNLKSDVSLGGKIFHPLVGVKILSAGKEHLYQHDLDLRKLPYLEDHQVANITILPGAGYLEIITASSRDVFKTIVGKDCDLLFVRNFLIESPLELPLNKQCRVQTIVSPNDADDTLDIKFYLYCHLNGYSDEKGWKLYASAQASKTPFVSEPSATEKTNVITAATRSNTIDIGAIKARCGLGTTTEEYYKKIPEIGILFGKTFQSVSKIWKGKDEALALIPVPENAGNMQDYVYHPIVLDAMIQAFGIVIAEKGDDKKDLFLPIGIDKFEMIKINKSSNMYAHVTWTEGQMDGHVVLYDENGEILCAMDGIRLVRTSLTSFLNVINAHNNKLPLMVTEIWRGRDGPLQSRVDYSKLSFLEDSKLLAIQDEYSFLNASSSPMVDRVKALEFITYWYLAKTFMDMGWKPVVGEPFTAKQLMTNLLISPNHEMLIERFLQIFCEEKLLKCNSDQGYQLYTLTTLPDFALIESRSENEIEFAKSRKVDDDTETIEKLMRQAQANLASVLLGEKSAVSALFGGETDPFVIYSLGLLNKTLNESIAKFIGNFYEKATQSESMIRILEVGGGTGATASFVLSYLKKRSIPFRYTFTDISQQFLEDAKKNFSDYSGIEYKLLNIEEDPKNQGFNPFHYDVVIGSNVLHAVADIRQTLKYLRHLMVPSGILCAMEMLKPCRYVDLIFGIFEGYWRFKDFDLRTSHCTLSQAKWLKVLSESGFRNFECPFPDVEVVAFFSQATEELYVHPVTSFKEKTSTDSKHPCFIIFDNGNDTCEILGQKLVSVGCNVVKIYHKATQAQILSRNTTLEFVIDPENEEDFNDILSKLAEKFTLHTILYFWSVTEIRDQKYICQGLLQLLKFLSSQNKEKPKVVVITRGNNFIGDQGKVYPSCATADGILTSFKNEVVDTASIIIDLDPDRVDPTAESQELFYEIWNNSSLEEKHVAFRNTRKYVSRFATLEKPPPPLRIPSQQRYCLIVPTTKSLNDVTYRPVDKPVLLPTDLEIEVKATALNFRDIFVILKPDMFKSLFESVGTDFSGIVSDIGSQVTKFKVGDEVFGISNNTSVASHVVVPIDLVMVKPKEFSFADACTLPSVFLTAYFCLIEVAQLKENETILIHVASGGVGLVAIQLAKLIGANIIATAGSKRKRAYLRSIGIEHVFHSRDISYGDEIERVTNGKGVDMVLNSITGPYFKEASLRVCAPNARFVEMGKVNIWQPEDVAKLRTDVQYTIVNVENFERNQMLTFIDKMEKLFKRGSIQPLPYTRFEGNQIKEALNYFLKAQHIGKIVVAMPEFSTSVSKQFSTDILFNSGSTYLITGGLGGIGLEVAKWMAKAGAKNLVLVARSQPDEKAIEVINHLNSKGCKTLSYQVDVGELAECENLFKNLRDPKLGLPPLRGIFHSAGALSDGFIKTQTWGSYEKVFNAKVRGGWNLHDLTKDMRMDFFVLFSSLAGTFGAPAQSNHAAANCFLDSLARYRHSIGLPAQAIDWGAWAEIGAATSTVYGNEGMFGIKPFTPNQGLSSLKYIVTRPLNRVGVVQADFSAVGDFMVANKKCIEEVVEQMSANFESQTTAEVDAFWSTIKDMDLDDRITYIKNILEKMIRKTLKLPDSEQMDDHQAFSEMGLDSLMAVEMRTKLQCIFGKHLKLNPTSLMDYPTMASLSKYLAEATLTIDIEAIQPAETNDSPQKQTIIDAELKNLIKDDSILPDHINDVGGCVSPSNIRTVLITGATGHLGAYLLKEILSTRNVKAICLIRGKNLDIARKRLMASLKKFDLLSDLDTNSIEVVIGDIAEKDLGLSEESYAYLSSTVDAIIHCAAYCHHFHKYQKSSNSSDIRSVNTLGTLHVLELASTKKTKRVVYPGSFASANELTEDGYLSENIPSVDNLGDGINFGYGISKLVAEKLIGQAIERGIPCTIARLPTLLGNSKTGLFTVESNLFMRLILTLAQLGVIPKLSTNWYCVPVDIISKVISQMAFNDKVESGLYNLFQTEMITIDEFAEVMKKNLGISIAIVPPLDFEEKVRSSSNDNLGISLVSSLVSGDVSFIDVLTSSCPAISMGLESGKSVYLRSSKIERIIPNFYDIIPHCAITLSKHVAYAKATGIIDAFIKL